MDSLVHVPVSVGELLDKISILQIKQERIEDAQKRANVTRELELLEKAFSASFPSTPAGAESEIGALKDVNTQLWDIEDDIRDHEHKSDFGASFVALARAVYITNDRRAAIKRTLNGLYGSLLVEEKSYKDYQSTKG